jgi:hypothetical protein
MSMFFFDSSMPAAFIKFRKFFSKHRDEAKSVQKAGVDATQQRLSGCLLYAYWSLLL